VYPYYKPVSDNRKLNKMIKKEFEKKRKEKKQEKQQRREHRKKSNASKSFEDMIAYVDEFGNITDTPPEPKKQEKVAIESIVISTPKKEEEEITPLTGKVDFFNSDRGFGFIKKTNSGEKYFFHINNAFASIEEGNTVTFDLERGKMGMNAVNITILE